MVQLLDFRIRCDAEDAKPYRTSAVPTSLSLNYHTTAHARQILVFNISLPPKKKSCKELLHTNWKNTFVKTAFDNCVQLISHIIGLLSHNQPSEGHGISALQVPRPQVSVLLQSTLIHSFPFITYTHINSNGFLVSWILKV